MSDQVVTAMANAMAITPREVISTCSEVAKNYLKEEGTSPLMIGIVLLLLLCICCSCCLSSYYTYYYYQQQKITATTTV